MENQLKSKINDLLSTLFYQTDNGEWNIIKSHSQINTVIILTKELILSDIRNYILSIPQKENRYLVIVRFNGLIQSYIQKAKHIFERCQDDDTQIRCETFINEISQTTHFIDEELINFDSEGILCRMARLSGSYTRRQAKPQPTPTAKKGRPKKTLKECFKVDEAAKEQYMQRLHSIMKDAKGKKAALAIRLLVEHNKMDKPPFPSLEMEFGNLGNVSGYNNQYKRGLTHYTQEEIEGMTKDLGL